MKLRCRFSAFSLASFASLTSFAAICGALSLPSAAAAAPALASTLLADFDDIAPTGTSQGGFWYFYDDRPDSGASYITTADSASLYRWDSTTFVPGQGGTGMAVELGFVMGAKNPVCGAGCTYAPQVGMGTSVAGGVEIDITGATAISFLAKAKAPIKVLFLVGTSDVKDNGFYGTLVNITTEWTKYTMPLVAGKDFAQAPWAVKKPFNPAHFINLGWMISKADNPDLTAGAFDLDNIAIEGWDPLDPSSISSGSGRAESPRIIRNGNRIRVDLGGLMHGKASQAGLKGRNPGMLEAMDARGRTLGRAAYGADALEVELNLGNRAADGPIYLHVTPK